MGLESGIDEEVEEPREELGIEQEEKRKIDQEAQKYFTDVSLLENTFLMALCGYRIETKIQRIRFLGKTRTKQIKVWRVDKESRILNEKGGLHIFHYIYPLICHIATTSNLTPEAIYTMWEGMITTLGFDILDNVFFQNNSFGVNLDRFSAIASFLSQLEAITLKGAGGFTMKEIAENISAMYMTRLGFGPEPRGKGGLGEGIKNLFKL